MHPPILCTALAGALRLVDLRQRRDDVVRPAELAQGELDAGPRGLLGLKENEFMGVGNDHARLPASLCKANLFAEEGDIWIGLSRQHVTWMTGTSAGRGN